MFFTDGFCLFCPKNAVKATLFPFNANQSRLFSFFICIVFN